MRAIARVFCEGLTLARVDKPLKEEAVGCWVLPMGKARRFDRLALAFAHLRKTCGALQLRSV